MKINKKRLVYFIVFALLFAAEVLIALFVHDSFIRPFVGDVLVVILLCAFLRILIPEKIKFMPVFATAFAVAVEIMQYFDFVKLLGLENNAVLSTALGRTFDIKDIVCYTIGGLIFFIAETLLRRRRREP